MKLSHKQLRTLIDEALDDVKPNKMYPRRRKGGARASLGFGIPEDSPGYGGASMGGFGSDVQDSSDARAESQRMDVRDMDNGKVYHVEVSQLGEMVSLRFGNSFTLTLDPEDWDALDHIVRSLTGV